MRRKMSHVKQKRKYKKKTKNNYHEHYLRKSPQGA